VKWQRFFMETFMKRSEINHIIKESIKFFNRMNFKLPEWGYWKLSDWKKVNPEDIREIVENMLGWDITDYGGNNFNKKGLILFTLRNGNLKKDKKRYAEKIMIIKKDQEAPMHFHWKKMEDIINRGGGILAIECYMSDGNENKSKKSFSIKIDGISRTIKAGNIVRLNPGESICLEPGIYHSFTAEKADVLVGEVSSVNDDKTDNRFFEKQGRFPEIEEDVLPEYLMVNDYKKFLSL